MKSWIRYQKLIKENTLKNSAPVVKDLNYWRDRLFAYILIYAFPVSLIALVPGVIMSVKTNLPALAIIDILAAAAILSIAFLRHIPLPIKKVIFLLTLYLLAIALMVFLGPFGPGMLYLLAITIFTNLIFPVRVAYWSIAFNTLISLFFALIIQYKLIKSPVSEFYNIGGWLAVSSNVLFLSIVITVLLNLVFNGLQKTIFKEAALQQELEAKKNKLETLVAALNQKNEELEQFAYIASHDLQEPLRTAYSLVENLEKDYAKQLDEDAGLHFKFLSQSLVRMRSLITGLLEYSRIGRDKALQEVDSRKLCEEILLDLKVVIQEKQARIIFEDLPIIKAYQLELRQLFQNLISNALKFHRKNIPPVVKIAASLQSDCWLFSVADNGIGIEEKYREKIFAIFQRLHPKSMYEGSGIGLAHCRKIVELHGGTIWVEPNPKGGSIFYFTVKQI